MGEYRGILNLCRVLPQGTAAKLAVDKAIDRLSTIGSIREDIQRCCLVCVNSLCSALHLLWQHPCRHMQVVHQAFSNENDIAFSDLMPELPIAS